MTFQQSSMTPAGAGDWVIDAVRRRPEAFLLMAAGCALLMRTGRRPVGSVAARMSTADQSRRSTNAGSSRIAERLNEAGQAVSGYASDVADKVSGTTRNVADSVTDYAETARQTVSGYAEDARRTVSGYAEDARRNLSDTSDRLMGQAETGYRAASDTIREQPILVAALGLAAGAAVAALFPATEVERRTLGVAGEALTDAAAETGENLLRAAGKAGDRLKEAAAEHGLDVEGLTGMAKDVAGTFTSAAGGSQPDRGPSQRGPQSPALGSSASQTGAQSPTIGSSASPSQRDAQTLAMGSSTSASGRPSDPSPAHGTSGTPTKGGSAGNVPGRS